MSTSFDSSKFTDDAILTDNHILTTTITAPDGTKLTSALDLNTVVGNVNGTFAWGGTNFSAGAQNIQITDGYQLEADLPDSNGQLAHSIMWIGSTYAVDTQGNHAIQHAAGTAYSAAHAVADTNDQADQAVLTQAGTAASSGNTIQSVTTIAGDAAQYWPDGNAPASGHHFSKPSWETGAHFGLMILECILRILL